MEPLVILIDTDEPTFELSSDCRFVHRHPQHISYDLLKEAALVLVDFKFDDWREEFANSRVPELLKPVDGLALAHSIRRELHRSDLPTRPAVALITGEYHLAAMPLDKSVPPHELARLNGIEWIFVKGEASLDQKIGSLATAVNEGLFAIASSDEEEKRLKFLLEYLGKPDEEHSDYFGEDVTTAHPPLHQLHGWNKGLLLLRWLLQRILPYPTFLIGDSYLACRAQCNLDQLQSLLSRRTEFLGGALYDGPCSEMFPRRFWRSGIERVFAKNLGSKQFDAAAVREFLSENFEEEIQLEEGIQEVIDPAGGYGNYIANRDSVKRAVLDDWPPFADIPWEKV